MGRPPRRLLLLALQQQLDALSDERRGVPVLRVRDQLPHPVPRRLIHAEGDDSRLSCHSLSSFQTASFAAFSGRALMIFRAGLALNTVGSLVNGLMPARSLVAGFLMTTNFARPGSTKAPFFFSSL